MSEKLKIDIFLFAAAIISAGLVLGADSSPTEVVAMLATGIVGV